MLRIVKRQRCERERHGHVARKRGMVREREGERMVHTEKVDGEGVRTGLVVWRGGGG